MPESFLWRRVTLEAFRLCLPWRGLDRFAVNADPAGLAVSLRFLFRTVALKALLFGVRFVPFDDLSVDAVPAYFSAAPARFFSGTETLAAPSLAFH